MGTKWLIPTVEELIDVKVISPEIGQTLVWNGSQWVNANESGGGNSPTNLLLPLYIIPPDSNFSTLITTMASYPDVPVTVIIAGPGASRQSNYTTLISQLQAAGATVIGYIYTSSATRALATVEADVAKWVSFYPAINGIFIDEMDVTTANIPYYVQLKNYINSLGINLVIGNSGVAAPEQYFTGAVADSINIWENNSYPDAAQASNNGIGTVAQKGSIAHSVSYNAADFLIQVKYDKYVLATDSTNYTALPSYIATLFAVLEELNTTQGVTSLNGLAGAVTVAAGTNITLTPSGNTITIAASGGGSISQATFNIIG